MSSVDRNFTCQASALIARRNIRTSTGRASSTSPGPRTVESGHLYGTLRYEIEKIAARGRVCLLELETEGAARVKQKVDGAVTIFISAPVDELERRLRVSARPRKPGEIG